MLELDYVYQSSSPSPPSPPPPRHLNRKCQIAMGSTGPQPQAPGRSGHYRPQPQLPRITVGTTGPQPQVPDRSGLPETTIAKFPWDNHGIITRPIASPILKKINPRHQARAQLAQHLHVESCQLTIPTLHLVQDRLLASAVDEARTRSFSACQPQRNRETHVKQKC